VIEDLAPLRDRLEHLQRVDERPPACPEDWGAVEVAPDAVEFWQESSDRLHERLRYEHAPTGNGSGCAWRRNGRRRLPHLPAMAHHTGRSTFAACIAMIAGVRAADVPLDEEDRRSWLAGRGIGTVPIADAASFAWPGPWIARRPSLAGGEPCAVVMFGVPSGAIWDPAGTSEEIIDGVLVAPLDIAGWEPPATGVPENGIVEAIVIAAAAGAPAVRVEQATAISGAGLEGDRYTDGLGTFPSGRPGAGLTLIDADVLDRLERELGRPVDHRRNVVTRGTDLNALVGRRFRLGEVLCAGSRLCEPCAHFDRLNAGGVLRPLVHRGGLRADIVVGGTLRVSDGLVVA